MKKHIIVITVFLFLITNIVNAQSQNKKLVGKWKFYNRTFSNDSLAHKLNDPQRMNLFWTFFSDSVRYELGSVANVKYQYYYKDSILNFNNMNFIVDRLDNDTLIIKKVATPNSKRNGYAYKDYFFKVKEQK